MKGLLLLLFAAVPVRALDAEREELSVIGWDTACSVAVTHLAFPRLGDAIVAEPIGTQIGTLTIPPGGQKAAPDWKADWGGANSWSAGTAQKAVSELVAAGYDHRGFPEEIRPDRIAPQRDLEEIIRSTDTLGARGAKDWPEADWIPRRINYNRLATCALVVFERKQAGKPFFRYVLARLYNTSARVVRSRAHLNNGLLLFGEGDLPGALAETAIAAGLYPQGPANRYHHAAMMALSGYLEESIAELAEALKLKPEYRAQALKDLDFESVRKHPRFKALMKPPEKPAPGPKTGAKPRR